MNPPSSLKDLRLAWAALASRGAGPRPSSDLSHERLMQLIEGRLDETERDAVLSALAHDPELWAAWRRLQDLVDETSPQPDPVPSRLALLGRWLGRALARLPISGPRLALAGAAAVAVSIGWGIHTDWSSPSALDGLPANAVAWVQQADDLRRAGPSTWRPPTVAAVASAFGRRSPLQPAPSVEEQAFEQGFRKGRRITQSVFVMQAPAAPATDESPTCQSDDCEQAAQLGLSYGAWATLTAVRCAAGLGPSEGIDTSSLEAERRSSEALRWVPVDFPWIDDPMGREPCEVAAAMHLRFPDPSASP